MKVEQVYEIDTKSFLRLGERFADVLGRPIRALGRDAELRGEEDTVSLPRPHKPHRNKRQCIL